MGEWQPIETAPVGKWILMWWISANPENTAAHCAMVGQVSPYRPDSSRVSDKPEYIWNPAAMSCSHNYDPMNDTGYQPIAIVTHWMPLPAPPVNGSERI